MKPRPRLWWSVYTACAVAVLTALAAISAIAIDLEQSEAQARVEVGHEQLVREALWRMDSWFAPFLAAEAARGVETYLPFRVGRVSQTFDQALNFRSRHVRQYFELLEGRDLVLPQAPSGVDRARALAAGTSGATADSDPADLRAVEPLITYEALATRVAELEDRRAGVEREQLSPAALNVAQTAQEILQNDSWAATKGALQGNNRALQARKQRNFNSLPPAQIAEVDAATDRETDASPVGPLVAVWLGDAADRELAFVRRVTVPYGDYYPNGDFPPMTQPGLQGFLIDWPSLESDLLEQVADLFPGASLVPVEEERTADDASGRVLVTVPMALVVAPPPRPVVAGSPTRQALWLTWAAVLCALAVAGVTLRASIAYGERRSRFASAVTHELRTPLTTFRLYAEMLADGMVADPDRQQEYLRTLQVESERLSSVVENVLAYSRLEQGRARGRIERLSLCDLIERLQPRLERRAAEADLALTVDVRGPGTDVIAADVEAIGQILLNLVDNACKYGASSETPRIDLTIDAPSGRVRFVVRDHGPGIDAAHRKAIFESFERAGRNDGSIPGVGLGLALSRGLARELGGDVTLDRAGREPGGARFVLDLPG